MGGEVRNAHATAGRGRLRESEGPSGAQAVARAIKVLEILARDGSAGVSDIAAELGVHKSTAFRLLATLGDGALVEQNAGRGKYQLGLGVLRLASTIPARLDMVRQAQPILDELADRLDETVNFAVLRDHHVMNLQQVRSTSARASHNWVGQLTPLHATSSGKALLAHLSPRDRDELLDRTVLRAFTAHTVVSRRELLAQLSQIRETNYATSFEELQKGLNAAASIVRDHTGVPVGAVSVSGPASRFDRRRVQEVEHLVTDAAERVGYRLGWMGVA